MEDNFNTPKAVYGKESFGGWTRRSRSLAAADFTEDGGPHLSSLLARLCRTRPQGSTPPPSHLDKVFEYMALMKRVQEDDAGANKRKKKGDYVDGNDEEDLQASEAQNEARS